MKEEETVFLTSSEKQIKDVLTNRIQYNENAYTEEIFQADLVLKMKYPEKKYISRNDQISLGSFIHNPSRQLVHAYNSAFEDLYADMEEVGDINEQGNSKNSKVVRLRNAKSFEEIVT